MEAWKRIEPTEVTKVGYRTVVSKTYEMPDGTIKHFETVNPEHMAAAAILAITTERKVLICRQYRPGPDMMMNDIPGGAVEPGESLEEAARRELLEETGYQPGAMTYLGVMRYDAYTNLDRHCFLATDCTPSPEVGHQDDEEFIELRLVEIDELLENARAGLMTDPGAVLLAYEQLQELQHDQ